MLPSPSWRSDSSGKISIQEIEWWRPSLGQEVPQFFFAAIRCRFINFLSCSPLTAQFMEGLYCFPSSPGAVLHKTAPLVR